MTFHEKDFERNTIGMLASLEKHVLNLIFIFQDIAVFKDRDYINSFIRAVQTPVKIDDSSLVKTVDDMKKILNESGLRTILHEFYEKISKIDIQQTFEEIKYIGNRLNEICDRLHNLEEAVKLRSVKIYCDGKEMVPNDDMTYSTMSRQASLRKKLTSKIKKK